jgi:hypothetical protein
MQGENPAFFFTFLKFEKMQALAVNVKAILLFLSQNL